jgi:uncharacterized protein (DUF934 family)
MASLIIGRRAASQSPSSPDEVVLRLEPGDDPEKFVAELQNAARVEVHFPKFGDGRGFSLARLLRQRYGYKGELRAVGEVARDHLYGMLAVGFDAFLLRDGESLLEALAAFQDFSASYQKGVRTLFSDNGA